MKKNIISTFLLGASALVLGGLASCEDYLTIYPTGSITKENFWNTKTDVDNVRAAAYWQMTNQVNNILNWGEFRSDNVTLNDMKQTQYLRLQEAVLQPTQSMFNWASMYKGINYCNEVLENGQLMVENEVDPSFTNGDWLPIKAEMVSLRALYYFYLVRAFRDVPYVTHSVSTDTEAKDSRVGATPGYVILDELIRDVEEAKTFAARNYGNDFDNKGRWTTYNMSALLADMYLWRAALLKGIDKKVDASGAPYAFEGNIKAEVEESLKKCIEHCDFVINYQKSEYVKRLDRLNTPENDIQRKQPFPLYLSTESQVGGTIDMGYETVFGTNRGPESVFELQYDAVNHTNGYYSGNFYGNPQGGFRAGTMVANMQLFGNGDNVDPEKGFGKLDFRYLSTGLFEKVGQNSFPIIKNVATMITVMDAKDVTKGYVGGTTPNFRNDNSNDASWPVYRLADVMLMKSEAIARSLDSFVGGNESLAMGFHLCNALFRRNVPAADSINSGNTNTYVKRLVAGWATSENETGTRTLNELLNLTFRERQREFVGEGKRWFDLVRECEWRGATEDVLSDWMGAGNDVKNRCRNLWALYNPIYLDEMKVNSPLYGDKQGKLVQNPVWQKYMPEPDKDDKATK